jgi:hypothetical protein
MRRLLGSKISLTSNEVSAVSPYLVDPDQVAGLEMQKPPSFRAVRGVLRVPSQIRSVIGDTLLKAASYQTR